MSRWIVRLVLSIAAMPLAQTATAQDVVNVGKGSYASFPPPGLHVDRRRNVDLVEEVEKRPLFLVKDDGSPIPSNKWYQNLLFIQYGTGLWAMPHRVDATAEGIEIFYPTKPDSSGTRMATDSPLVISGKGFKPIDSRAKQWTDWTVAFRMFESDSRYMDVTLGEGMPAVWCEFTGVQPLIALGGQNGKGSRSKIPAAFFDLGGKPIALPATGDALGIQHAGRSYAVFAPDNTRFESSADGIDVKFPDTHAYLIICPLPADQDIQRFHDTAFAIPRDTRVSWNYDRKAGVISTTWKITTEPLKGDNHAVIQGWLPHHWRENLSRLELNGPVFQTIRGALKCSTGTEFSLSYPFTGILPNYPAPARESGYSTQRLSGVLSEQFAGSKRAFASDTYAGGKDLQRFAQAAFVAQQIGDPAYDQILEKLRTTMESWLTYTPGKRERFFAYYPHRKGLVGFNPSFGSEHFTDNHFHYGYFVYAAGLLSQLQGDFAANYGEMARLIARQYANYDRQDKRFPFFRTFDLWRGHSFADGNGFPDGNNQESTGEAINSWAGMILLGTALDDPELTAAGVMGYSFESRANLEYWFDPHGDVFPPTYAHKACGMIWCNSIVWGTWFTASPSWIYGIQWLPSGPDAAFYDRDPGLIKKIYADLQREQTAFEEKQAKRKPDATPRPVGLQGLGGELASYHLGFVMHADPDWVIQQLDTLRADPADKMAHDPWLAMIDYEAHSLKGLGRVDWNCHGDSPTSMVYRNSTTGVRTCIAWNPTGKEQVVAFFENGRPLGTLRVPAARMVASPDTRLQH